MYAVVSAEALKKMNGVRGKLGAQCGHAFLHSWWDAAVHFPEAAQGYMDSDHAYKIVLLASDDATLHALHAAYAMICGVSLVEDAGFTVFNEPTITCLGIGPINEEDIGDDLRVLKTLT